MNLPPDSATRRAMGDWTPLERIADLVLQNASAARKEFAVAHGGKDRGRVLTYIGHVAEQKARRSETFDDVAARIARSVPAAPQLPEAGDE